MTDNLVKKLPPFSHIKVLENGNYGCTLVVANKIYNGIFTPNWECLEKLHLVEVDAYTDLDYINAEVLIPMPYDDEEDITQVEDSVRYAEYLYLNFEDDNDVDSTTQTIGPPALFCMQYINKDDEVVVNTENTLMPYKYAVYSFLRNLFDHLEYCNCSSKIFCNKLCWDKILRVFNLDYEEKNMPFIRALKKMYDEYNEFEDRAKDQINVKIIDDDLYDFQLWDKIINMMDDLKQQLFDGAYDLCEIFYLMFLRDNCKEYIDVEI